MASHTSKVVLFVGRINVSGLGLQKPVSRVTYTTSFFANSSGGKKGRFDKDGQGFVKRPRRAPAQPRTEKMPVDQDWTSVFPTATTFRPSSVPLPLRMGYPMKGAVPLPKMGNLELIKIPNFLHLTPGAIKKHCEALKSFCTEWPSVLDTDAKCDEHFPIKVESTDYVSAGPSVRNPSARIVHLKVKLSHFNLDDHARKKMIKLVGARYCKDTDILSMTADSCPLRQQNYEYALYLLTVLYHESWKTEDWEAEKSLADMEEYSWEDSPSQKNMLDILVRMKVAGEEEEGEEVREQLLGKSEVQEYKDSVMKLKNEGMNERTMLQYKEAVVKVLNL
ncbi:small ribosomal subunit protein mS35 [Cottoperca gobio]|uniref:Small ribosomal subunit protein mS35 n=1 Tax=Cottoperca gobio TaxID=56716 RepID=A0A6J2PYP2_COTGO|nr:28S ribosomal protein S35, mitochondrial [Cottoperca gobio]